MAVNNTNPFFTEKDTQDRPFGMNSGQDNFQNNFDSRKDPFQDDDEPIDFAQIQENSMNRQLESTQRCLASLYDSEAMGVATAEELVQQGEQLNNTEHKLDIVNQDMKTTQKHLNNIKSVFGGIKNWWQGKQDAKVPEKPTRDSQLQHSLDQSKGSQDNREHPALRMRSDDNNGLYDRPAAQQTQATAARSDDWQQYESTLDDNLGAMSAGLARLRGLGLGLGQEIETQNDQIERITNKAERADVTVKDQNKQMKHILKN